MITENSLLIYYPGGAYGMFIEWCLQYFTDPNFPEDLPFDKQGSSHQFQHNLIRSDKTWRENISSSKEVKFVSVHPHFAEYLMQTKLKLGDGVDQANFYASELEYWQSKFNNVIFLYFDSDSFIWGWNNLLTKAKAQGWGFKSKEQFVRHAKDEKWIYPIDQQNAETDQEQAINVIRHLYKNQEDSNKIEQWINKDTVSRWEVRELLSYYLFPAWRNTSDKEIFKALCKKFPNVLLVNISELRDNFDATIRLLINKSGRSIIRETEIDNIFNTWSSLQKFKFNDLRIKDIANNLTKFKSINWDDLETTIFDEAYLQFLLRENGYNIKCFELNKFPTSSKEMLPLLEEV